MLQAYFVTVLRSTCDTSARLSRARASSVFTAASTPAAVMCLRSSCAPLPAHAAIRVMSHVCAAPGLSGKCYASARVCSRAHVTYITQHMPSRVRTHTIFYRDHARHKQTCRERSVDKHLSLSGRTGRLLTPMALLSRSMCASAKAMGFSSTTHVTVSVHGGVVKLPW